MAPASSTCARRPAMPSVNTGGCSSSQSSSGVVVVRAAVKACMAATVAA
jgi:hypothetical protein